MAALTRETERLKRDQCECQRCLRGFYIIVVSLSVPKPNRIYESRQLVLLRHSQFCKGTSHSALRSTSGVTARDDKQRALR